MNEPAPDPSRPFPSLGDVFKAFTPAGTDPDALMAALKASEMPSVSSQRLSDAITSTADMQWCQRCARPEPATALCPAVCAEFAGTECVVCNKDFGVGEHRYCMGIQPAGAVPSMPADPFAPGAESGVAARILYDDMVSAGIPLSSVENIIGCMLAALIRDSPVSEES